MKISLYENNTPDIITEERREVILKIVDDILKMISPYYSKNEITSMKIEQSDFHKYNVTNMRITIETKYKETDDVIEVYKRKLNQIPETTEGLNYISIYKESLSNMLMASLVPERDRVKGFTELIFDYHLNDEEFKLWNGKFKTYMEI
jgi:hypothetical protein